MLNLLTVLTNFSHILRYTSNPVLTRLLTIYLANEKLNTTTKIHDSKTLNSDVSPCLSSSLFCSEAENENLARLGQLRASKFQFT